MITEYFTKRKTKKFIVSMSQTLANDYGQSNEYTEGQVKTALRKLGYDANFEEVAIGVFCNEEIAKGFGIGEALIKRYRGYSREHNIGCASCAGADISGIGD